MRTTFKNMIQAGIGLLIFTAAVGAGTVAYRTQPRQVASALLRIDSPPSMRNVVCESWGVTDVLTTCAFEVTPSDFSMLLKGRPFKQIPASGESYDYAGGPKVGRKFLVATEFFVTPREFMYGGRISLVTNAQRSRAQVDYYEE